MSPNLKKKSFFTYMLISIVYVLILFVTVFMVYSERSTAENINVTGNQRMLSQRIALLCNNYYDDKSNEKIKSQIQRLLSLLTENHDYIKNIGNKKVDEILYDSRYQYDNLTQNYKKNVLIFLESKNLKHLKVINYTNESLLNISNTLTELMTVDFKSYIKSSIIVISVLSVVFIVILILLYKNITIKTIVKMEDALKEIEDDERFIKSILDNSPHAIIVTDTDGVITLFSREAENLLGYKSEELIYKHTPEIFHKKDEVVQKAELLSKELGETIEPGFDMFIEKTKRGLKNRDEWTYISKDKKEISVVLSITALRDQKGDVTGYIGTAEDITDIKAKEREIKNYLKLIDENIITSSTDVNGLITFSSKAFSDISGYTKEELIGKNHRLVKHEDMPSSIYKELWETILNDKVWHGEIKNKKKDGGFYWVDATISPVYDLEGHKTGYTAIRQNITDKKMVEILSITDALTNLYNRRYFNDIAQREIDRARRNKIIFAFALLDIDNFKKYNDTYGHQEGDSVLKEVSKTLKNSFQRSEDIVFRLGGEEFGVIISANSADKIKGLVEKARENIELLQIEHKLNTPKVVTASFGLLILNFDDFSKMSEIDSIYKYADELLYTAKENGRNRVVSKEI